MKHKDFTYKELLGFGWNKTKQHFWFLLGLALVYIVLMVVTINLPLINNIISTLLSISIVAVTLVICAGQTPKFKDALKPFNTYKVLWHYILASILYILILVASFIFFILPAIYLSVRLQFYAYLVIEHKDMGPIEALKKSMEMTKDKFWKLFGFGLVLVLVNIAGLLALGIGLLFTIPMSGIAYTYLYKKLEGVGASHEHHHTEVNLATA